MSYDNYDNYDYLIVGAGLFGVAVARQLTDCGKKVLVIEKSNILGGTIASEEREGIHIHLHGPHVFHTNSLRMWEYVQKYATWYPYTHRGRVIYDKKLYSFPINLFTMNQLWGVTTPSEAYSKILSLQIQSNNRTDLKSYALSIYGQELYEKFFEGYSIKQWGKDPSKLPSSILKRLPLRFDNNDNYFRQKYQGIPEEGYSTFIKNMLQNIDVELNVDFLKDKDYWEKKMPKIIYSGRVDELCNYIYGELEFRSCKFEIERLDNTYQGCAVVNYPEIKIPYTRIVEHKFFVHNQPKHTFITKEYPVLCTKTDNSYYPINDERNNNLYKRYIYELDHKYVPGGRCGGYKYFDMDQVIVQAHMLVTKLINP